MRDSDLDAAQEKPLKSLKKRLTPSRTPSPLFFNLELDSSENSSSEELPDHQLYQEHPAGFKEASDRVRSSSDSGACDDTSSYFETTASSGSVKPMMLSTPPLRFAPQKSESSKIDRGSLVFAFSPPGSSKKYNEETADSHIRLGYTI